jgi:hypothetical protein
VHRRDLHVLGAFRVGFELVDLVRFLEGDQRQSAEVFLQDADATADRGDASQPCRFDAAFDVGVEKRRDVIMPVQLIERRRLNGDPR